MKKYYPSWQTNPSLLGKAKTEDLCRKSYWIFKSKWKWRKLIELSGSNIATLEKEFDTIIEKHEEQLQLKLKKLEAKNESTVSESDGGVSDGTSTETIDRQEV